jgi:L-seryl-tRNA(Ser) seleniumtransferase
VDTPAPDHATAADLPSLDRTLRDAAFAPLIATHGHTRTAAALRGQLGTLRRLALDAKLQPDALHPETLARAVSAALAEQSRPRLRRVFNLTGTVLHTNLGRAPLPESAAQAVARALAAPVNLEYDLRSGKRGDRDSIVEALLCELTGAEAATVVNNNAAAVLLLLHALAQRREVVISRGELVEIGGSFRIPDVMRAAGAKLVEVGTTNRTHRADYASAIGARTALLMKVHTSNYAVSGFTSSVGVDEIVAIAREHNLPTVVDLGSGSLVDLSRWGLPKEPTVGETLAAGADLVTFSGDKVLGGPQAGIVVGRADLVARLKKTALRRALRVDKMTLAALEPVVALYREPELLAERLTTLQLLTRPADAMQAVAARLRPALQQAVGTAFVVTAEAMASQIGSGALPVDRLDSHGLVVRPASTGASVNRLQARLRALPTPVIGRVADDALWLDLRCLPAADEHEFLAQLPDLLP